MSSRLVLIAAAPGAQQHRGVAPRPDDQAGPLDDASTDRLRASIGTLVTGWHAPERAARDTAIALGASTDEAPQLAAWWGPDAGEPLDDVLARTGAWLAALGERRAVVVASPPVVRALIVHALGAPAGVFWRLDVAVLSVSVLTRADATWRVRSISDR
jgi:Histidine phosphatase superfamily (branch 1)